MSSKSVLLWGGQGIAERKLLIRFQPMLYLLLLLKCSSYFSITERVFTKKNAREEAVLVPFQFHFSKSNYFRCYSISTDFMLT